MKLRDIDFGPCLDAAGVRGWMNEGYWFHHLPLVRRWYDFDGSTRVSKTTTLRKRDGNMPILGRDRLWGPRDFFPRCIWVDWFTGATLNSVALTGPGAEELIEEGIL